MFVTNQSELSNRGLHFDARLESSLGPPLSWFTSIFETVGLNAHFNRKSWLEDPCSYSTKPRKGKTSGHPFSSNQGMPDLEKELFLCCRAGHSSAEMELYIAATFCLIREWLRYLLNLFPFSPLLSLSR